LPKKKGSGSKNQGLHRSSSKQQAKRQLLKEERSTENELSTSNEQSAGSERPNESGRPTESEQPEGAARRGSSASTAAKTVDDTCGIHT